MSKNKISGHKLKHEVKELYSENYKTLINEIEYNSKKWNDIPCSWIGRINNVKIAILPKATKGIKYLGINLPKETKDLYAETVGH